MLPGELLLGNVKAGVATAFQLEQSAEFLEMAAEYIAMFTDFNGLSRGDLDEALLELEGDCTDFKVRRGSTHLLYGDRTTFETRSPIDPSELRSRVFALDATQHPSRSSTQVILEHTALELSAELGVPVASAQLEEWLYADLKANQVIAFDPPSPAWLVNRFNVAQVQGLLYKASELVITAHRNDPGEYKLLFKYLKLFGLMHRITGHPDAGYSITLDGPSSLFKSTTLYGIRFAAFLPALLHATKWSLEARLHTRVNGEPTEASFTLDSSTTLTSHYPPGKTFDSILESGFAAAFAKLDTPWRLEREVELVDLGGTVMIPDFRLVHPDGRAVLLEIVGYWRPEYLKRKFEKIARSNRTDLVIAVSERLNLGSSAKTVERLEDQIVWFKGALPPKRVLEVAERLEGHPQSI